MFHIKPAERNQIRLSGARLNLNRTVPPTQDSREAEKCLLDNGLSCYNLLLDRFFRHPTLLFFCFLPHSIKVYVELHR